MSAAEKPLIVEIGPDNFPVYRFSNRLAEKIEAGALYVGVDVEENSLEELKREGVTVKVGDLGHIPSLDDSVDELWLMNVFGGFRNIPEKTPDGILHYSSGSKRYFDEMTRVLKKHGVIYIGETYPREGGKGSTDWLMSSDYHCFGLRKEVFSGSRVGEFLMRHGIDDIYIYRAETPFFITLEKM